MKISIVTRPILEETLQGMSALSHLLQPVPGMDGKVAFVIYFTDRPYVRLSGFGPAILAVIIAHKLNSNTNNQGPLFTSSGECFS